MDPSTGIAPEMSNNEALRRLLAQFIDPNGNIKAGAPGGPIPGKDIRVTKVTATGPLPALAAQLVPERLKRTGMVIRNLDDQKTIWWSDDPAVTDDTGSTLKAEESVPVGSTSAIYVYCIEGTPEVECTEVLAE